MISLSTIKITLLCRVTAVVTTFLAIFTGYALSRFKFKWNRLVMIALLSSQMFPIVSRMISLYGLMGKVHLLDTTIGLIFALIVAMLPFSSILMAGFLIVFLKQSKSLAYIDGAGKNGYII